MSQQQMNADEINRDEPHSSYAGYQGTPHNDSYSYGQKISARNSSSSLSAGQRLALAIVSLSLWVVIFIVVVLGTASTSPENPVSHILYPLLIISLLIFSGLVLAINIMFNQKH